ncbi:MAG: NUDIX domain-containing protein [Anaerolineaceae bacterium]|nr:NUDIX domain-containing protein [Anaerolineaceae bacterium]
MENAKQILLPDRYMVVPRSLIFIINKDEILLIKGAPDKKIWPGYYNGIGGHIERGENILDAAKRELFEETGIHGLELNLKAVINIDVEKKQGITLFVFLGETTKKELNHGSEGNVEWVKIEELSNFQLVEDLHILIPKLLDCNNSILFGYYYYDNEGGQLRMEFK